MKMWERMINDGFNRLRNNFIGKNKWNLRNIELTG